MSFVISLLKRNFIKNRTIIVLLSQKSCLRRDSYLKGLIFKQFEKVRMSFDILIKNRTIIKLGK